MLQYNDKLRWQCKFALSDNVTVKILPGWFQCNQLFISHQSCCLIIYHHNSYIYAWCYLILWILVVAIPQFGVDFIMKSKAYTAANIVMRVKFILSWITDSVTVDLMGITGVCPMSAAVLLSRYMHCHCSLWDIKLLIKYYCINVKCHCSVREMNYR